MSWFNQLLKRLFGSASPRAAAESTAVAPLALTPEETAVVGRFEERFSLEFLDKTLIATALKHRSYLNMTNEPRNLSNERLEFLGDAVLDLVVTHFLYRKFPKKTEGHLSKVKSILVSKPVMADLANEFMNLGDIILMNHGEEKTGGRQRKSILADAFEAIIGAIYLDKGLAAAEAFIQQYILADYKRILRKGLYKNFKSILLEHAQGIGEGLPEYRVVEEKGPDHAKEFIITVSIGTNLLGEGRGNSKKIAEQEAAKHAVRKLELEEDG